MGEPNCSCIIRHRAKSRSRLRSRGKGMPAVIRPYSRTATSIGCTTAAIATSSTLRRCGRLSRKSSATPRAATGLPDAGSVPLSPRPVRGHVKIVRRDERAFRGHVAVVPGYAAPVRWHVGTGRGSVGADRGSVGADRGYARTVRGYV